MTNPPPFQITREASEASKTKHPNISLRQLDCLTAEDCPVIKDIITEHKKEKDAQNFAAILTHDCSISGTKIKQEPNLEIILGSTIKNPDGNLTNGKNPRKLHIKIHSGNEPQWIELNICSREFIPKQHFDGTKANNILYFKQEEQDQIKRWLAARYQAPAYPNEYEKRLKINKLNKKIEHAFSQDTRDLIDGLFLILHPRKEELQEDEPYELELLLLVKPDVSDGDFSKIVEIRNKIVELIIGHREHGITLVGFHDKLEKDEIHELIPIRSDDEISVYEYRQFDKMRLDFLSEGDYSGLNPQMPLTK